MAKEENVRFSKGTSVMIPIVFGLVFSIMMISCDTATTSLEFDQTYSGATDFAARGNTQTADGGYLLCGNQYVSPDTYTTLVVKTDKDGNEIWKKTYADTYSGEIMETADGEIIMAGRCTTEHIFLSRLSADGDLVFNKRIDVDMFEYLRDVSITSDGGCISIGLNMTTVKYYVRKIDIAGEIEWEQAYDASVIADAGTIRQTKDGGYIFPAKDNSGWGLVKLDASGSVIWSRTFLKKASSYLSQAFYSSYGFSDIQELAEGGFIVSGDYYNSIINTEYPVAAVVLKFSTSGEKVWEKRFSCSNISPFLKLGSIAETADGNYVTVGYKHNYSTNEMRLWIVKYASGGSLLLNKTYDEDANYYFHAVSATEDGGFAISTRATDALRLMKFID